MPYRHMSFAALAVSAMALAGCADREAPILMHAAASSDGPDEFSIVPTRPLSMPPNLSELPPPTPGGRNRVDPEPRADVARALGGDPGATAGPADPGLVAHASRFGRDSGIREQLAAEDLEIRRRNRGRLLERWFAVNVYHNAYRNMWLDKHAEQDRWRRAGIETPAAPPRAQ